MKVSLCKLFRSARVPALGILAFGAMVGCGDKSSDPDAVTEDELKGPGALSILDQGNGSVTLSWSGSNNEDDFDGYNVYGMKATSDNKIADEADKSIELLDDAGEPVADSRTLLAKFNYGTEKKFEEAAAATDDDGASKFSALPVHGLDADGTTPLLPTCKPSSDGTCAATTATNLSKKGTDVALNGTTTFAVTGLTVGSTYCFTVLSSMDAGAKVSQTSSKIRCVTPKYAAAFDMELPNAASDNRAFDLRAYLTTCTATGCAAPTAAQYTVDAGSHFGEATEPVYIEWDSATAPLSFVAGHNSAIIDLGYYADGFDDATLPQTPPGLVIDNDTYDANNNAGRTAPIYNQGGYSIAGQSVPIAQNHIYVIAVGAEGAPVATEFHYQWLRVKGDPTGTTVAVEMRLSKDASQ